MKYVENAVKVFLDTGTRFPRRIIWAMGMIKFAAASANIELGLLDERRGEAIKKVALKLAEGGYDDLIVVDVFQTGSGTGLNMNVNEVIAMEASKIAGVQVHPNDHVNKSQSSNDVVPTAIRVAALAEALWRVKPALNQLIASLDNAASRFQDTVKPGRTHLRDALPVTLGQELDAFKRALEADMRLLDSALNLVRLVPLGGTAVGTGLNAHPDYPRLAVSKLAEATGLPLAQAESRFRAMRLLTDLVSLSGAYRAIALDLWRLGQDLRLMYSGPNTGLAEIDIPQAVPGSSMMPGKVNPVTVEAVMQASAQVVGLDQANSMANLLGELELSMGIPLVGYNIVTQSILLGESLAKLSTLVVDRLEARRERMTRLAESSQALVTVLAPVIGYDKAAELSRLMGEGRSIREALEKLGYSREEVEKLLDLKRLTKPGIPALGL
ncbi:MAG: class II fumarate hydratase [Desulfurococcales archaeon]|nr:class II fumarate hydratase [Desulfurococcales archaeon]MCE4605663.1 class II fumarate hydratase [Desulfurococcales archaeon]